MFFSFMLTACQLTASQEINLAVVEATEDANQVLTNFANGVTAQFSSITSSMTASASAAAQMSVRACARARTHAPTSAPLPTPKPS